MPRPLSFLFLWLPPALYLALVFYLSSLPNPFPSGMEAPAPDWLLHGLEYGLLQVLFLRAFCGGFSRLPSLRLLACSALACVFIGALDEFWQSFTPGRDATAWDVLADAMGAVLGSAAFVFFVKARALRAGKKNSAGAA